MRIHQAIVLSLIILSGCTATQLRYETLNQAGTVESITEKQIFFNLEQFDKNPYAFPSQITVIAGSASTTDSVSPTFMTPLGMATTATSQFANATQSSVANALVATTSNTLATAVTNGTSSLTTNGTTGMTTSTTGGMTTNTTSTTPAGPESMTAIQTSNSTAVANGTSNSVANGTTGGTTTTNTAVTNGGNTKTNMTGNTGTTTDSSASTRPNRTLSLAMSDNWMESWTLDPVVNPDVLRRLSALYRYVLGESDAAGTAVPKDKHGFPDRQKFKAWLATDTVNNPLAVDDQFMCEYSLPPAAPGGGGGNATTTTTTTTSQGLLGTVTTTETGPEPPAANDGQSVTLVFRCLANSDGKYHKRTVRVKRSSLTLPGCVICLDESVPTVTGTDVVAAFQSSSGTDVSPDPARPYVNPNLHFGFIVRDNGSNNVHLGRAFYGDVSVEKNPHLAFHEFESLVNAATIVDSSTSATTGGTKGSNAKVLALPVSPNGFLLK